MGTGIFVGAGVGLLNGIVCHGGLVYAIDKSDKVFYWIWAAGFGYRMLFFALTFFMLVKNPVLPLVPTLLALVAGQFVVGVIPLKRTKRSEDRGQKSEIDSNQGLPTAD